MATDSESTMLTDDDRRLARDLARGYLDALRRGTLKGGGTITAEEASQLAAAIRDLDAVSRGPL